MNSDGNVQGPKPLYKETAARIFKAVFTDAIEYKFRSIIPENIKYVDNEKELSIVWVKKKSVEKLFFSKDGKGIAYACPNLLFKIKNDKLFVVAIKKFGLDQKVYYAPFPNIGKSSICMGSASLKLQKFKHFEDIVEYAESQFFNSVFTHEQNKYHKLGKDKKVYDNNWLEPILKNKNTNYNIKDFLDGKV